MDNVNKITVIGGSGTGKTTLANNLEKILNLPAYHIDGINYGANWLQKDKEERDKVILEKIDQDKWIMDGTYHSTLSQRFDAADLIIYLDYSSFSQIKGILGRFIKNHGKEKPEIPGCKEELTLDFFLWVLRWRKNKREEIIEKLNNIDKYKVLIFKNRRQLNKWYKRKFGEKIITK